MSNSLDKRLFVLSIIVCILMGLSLIACSKAPSVGNSSNDDYSIQEYNSDIDHLESLLTQARNLNHQIDAMGDTNQFTTQEQVDRYNSLVDQYNSVADQYRNAVRKFNDKYAAHAEGDGSRPTDPDNIELPKRK